MLIRGFGYMMISDEKTFNEKVNSSGRIDGIAIKKPTIFPAFFKFCDSFDPRCCGDWDLCTGNEMIAAFQSDVEKTSQMVKSLKEQNKMSCS